MLVLESRARDLGGFSVRRTLPAGARRMVGPFIFFDHFGPVAFPPGAGMDVRPHPHVHLATVTYLFEGEIVHRDSLGSHQPIRPGDVNWMNAGRGIVHSERTDPARRAAGARLHGLQAWVALPRAHEDSDPTFAHHPVATLPVERRDGVTLRLVAGTAYGREAPTRTWSPLCYVDAQLDPGATLPVPGEHPECGVYVVEGAVSAGDQRVEPGSMIVFDGPGAVRADGAARVVLVGGAPLDGPRYVWWNFVSSSQERIDQASRDWAEGRFPRVPGDDVEFIPLPPR